MKGNRWLWVIIPAIIAHTGNTFASAADQVAALLKKGDYPEALKSADVEIKAGNSDLSVRFYRAVALAQLGQIDAAIVEFSSLAKEQPKKPEPHNNLAVLYAKKGEFDKARSALEAALATDTSYNTAHKNLGDLYAAMAAQAYNRALARNEQRDVPLPKLALLDSLATPAPAALQAVETTDGEPLVTAAVATPLKTEPVVKAQPKPAPASKPIPKPAPQPSPQPTPKPVAAPEPVKPTPSAPPRTRVTLAAAGPVMDAPAVPMPTAAVAPVATAPAGDLQAQAREVEQTVRRWGQAWSDQNVSTYLVSYSETFKPEDGLSLAAWKQQRTERISKPTSIAVKLVDLQVKLLGEGRAAARFIQVYQSERYEDTIEKRLDLVHEASGWKIVREISGTRHH